MKIRKSMALLLLAFLSYLFFTAPTSAEGYWKFKEIRTGGGWDHQYRPVNAPYGYQFGSAVKTLSDLPAIHEITGRDGAPMVLIPAGEFLMGSPEGEGFGFERPQHRVYLDAYYIDKYPVTVAQYRKFCQATGRNMPATLSWGWIDNHPMVNVSWEDAVAYAEYYGKRLPTEAEWAKACRAGSTTRYYFGDDASRLGEYAWYIANSGSRTQPVGQKKPNAWGLFDMHGNVWEWCNDWYEEDYYRNSPSRNPMGPHTGSGRVLRGGSWSNSPDICRSAIRNWGYLSNWFDFFGIRCAMSAGP